MLELTWVENQPCYFWCHSDEGGITYREQLMRFLLRRNDKIQLNDKSFLAPIVASYLVARIAG
jgi:hypothetical protein